MRKIIFEKRQLRLKEEDINIQSKSLNTQSNKKSEVNVDPSSSQGGAPNLANDVKAAKQKNPNAGIYTFNPSAYAGQNKSGNPTTINIKANNGTDLSSTLSDAMNTNPQVAQAVNAGNATVRADLENESINFTKKELDNFLMNL